MTDDGCGVAVGKPERVWNQGKVVAAHLNILNTIEMHTLKWLI